MPDAWASLGDYYKPVSAKEIIDLAVARDGLENQKVRNRLLLMQEQDAIKERQQKRATEDWLLGNNGNAFGLGQGPQRTGANPQSNAFNMPMPSNKNAFAQQAMGFYQMKGWKPDEAAAIVGNLLGESSGSPNAVGDGGKSFGLAQWNGERRQKLFAYASSKGEQTPSVLTQLEFTDMELKGDPRATDESKAGNALRNAVGLPAKVESVYSQYERPKYNEKSLQQRTQYAQNAWGQPVTMTDAGGGQPQSVTPRIPAAGQANAFAPPQGQMTEEDRNRRLAQINAAMPYFQDGIKNAIASKDQKTITAYLDYVDQTTPYLKQITQFYRGIQFKEDGSASGTIPKMAPELLNQYIGNMDPKLIPIARQAAEMGLPVKFETDKNRKVVKLEVPDHALPTHGQGKSKTKEQLAEEAANKKWQDAGNQGKAPVDWVTDELSRISTENRNPNELQIWMESAEDTKKQKTGTKLTPQERQDVTEKYEFYKKTGIKNLDNLQETMQALAEGRLTLADITKRSQAFVPLTNELLKRYPGLNLAQAIEQHRYRGTEAYHKAQTALEAIPTALEEVTQRGIGLDFPNLKKAAEINAWADENLGDPKFTGYLTARNDAIQNLAQAFRGGVATDMAQKLEDRAVPIPLNPKALYEWYKVQMKLVEPRLKRYGIEPPKVKSFEELIKGESGPNKSGSDMDQFWK